MSVNMGGDMFTEKEVSILKALIEEEIGDVLCNGLDGEPLFEDYFYTLKGMIFKVSCDSDNEDRAVSGIGDDVMAQPVAI